MKLPKIEDLWLKILALVLALIVYHTLKTDSAQTLRFKNDGQTIQHR
jgi:hypothetical protein